MKLLMEIIRWGLSEEMLIESNQLVLGDWKRRSRLSQPCALETGGQAWLQCYSRVTSQAWLCTESVPEEKPKQQYKNQVQKQYLS